MKSSLAVVFGDLSLVRALGRQGIPVALATSNPHSVVARSRYCHTVIATPDTAVAPLAAIEAVSEWAKRQLRPPVVFCQGDNDLLALSRHRAVLAPHARFALPAAALVEDLVDKLRFAALAARCALPVPRTMALRHDDPATFEAQLRDWSCFPCVLKPAHRARWIGTAIETHDGPARKALHVASRHHLDRLVPHLRKRSRADGDDDAPDFIVQEAIAGGEDEIFSYHAYLRAPGDVVADCAGRKVRTAPRRYGFSTCVEIVDKPDVVRLGREVSAAIGLFGVVKMDFKRDAAGRLYLLEVNPRFNLWHHPLAVAGMCLPALVYADCCVPGSARWSGRVRSGVRWISTRDDRRAFGEQRDASWLHWVRDVISADVNEDLCWFDPLPSAVSTAEVIHHKARALWLGGLTLLGGADAAHRRM
jgi:predicted ATP-grasp superfamily ATP-dependent carboligase